MKKVLSIVLAMLMLIGASTLAEKTLNVTGSGTVYLDADIAYASLGVSYTGADLSVIQQQANETIEAVCKAMEEAGLDAKNISTDNINIYPMYDYSENDSKLTGYRIDERLSIHTEDIDALGAYIDAAFAAGANTFDSITFSVKDDSQAKKDALKKAVQDAREKAEIIAEASGEEIDSVVTISENEQYSYYNTDSRAYVMKAETADVGAGTTVRAAQINVSADVQITYRLK
mgnify:CR=1 FL=1